MKFVIPQADFAKPLAIVARSILPKANLPVLSNILVSTNKNKLELLSTNLETAIKIITPCKTEREGEATIVCRSLLEFVSQLPEGKVTLEQLGEEVLITTDDFSARLPTMPVKEFPAIPKIEKGKELKVAAKDFARSAAKVIFCAAQDEGRPILTGILFEIKKDKLSMVATDGYRLSYEEVPIERTDDDLELKVVIPAKAVTEIAKIIDENSEEYGQEDVSITIADSLNQLNFKIGSIEFTSRLIEGEFPNWQKIIPTTFTTKAKAFKVDLIRLIRITSIFARDSGNIVKLTFTGAHKSDKGELSVSATASQTGSGDAKMEVGLIGKGGEIAFNFRYLLEALSVIEGDEIYFEMIESLNPGRITSVDEKGKFFHIIMPVRLQS